MAKEYFVIDNENNTVWQGKEQNDAPQVFKSFAAAEKRARETAEATPGEVIKIVGVEAIVICDVMQARTEKVR